jgi:hypothetical protein
MEMFKSKKSQLTCSYCSKIYKDPIILPCGDSICREHISERDVVKENRIKCKKCKKCNKESGVKSNTFQSNQTLKKLVKDRTHLSKGEINLKQELEVSVGKFFELYDEFAQNKNKNESDVFDHFQEMCFKVDEQREELKNKIDDLALELIDQIKKCEESLSKNLKENFSSFDETKSLENELNQIEETFRDPNLLIETIQAMQQKQEESLKEIQFKLNQMHQVKDDLKATNDFKPNLSSFQQNETSLFGSIRLNGCWLNLNLFKSQVIKGERQMSELIDLCEFSPNDKWSLLYRGTRDGFGTNDFHSKCDGHSNTLTILKAKESGFIFGGFASVDWESCPKPGKAKSDPNAFIFSLTNKDNRPLKMKIDPDRHHYAIGCYSKYGPIFGGDIQIFNNANTTMDSFSNLGFAYKHPQYEYFTDEADTFLAGSYQFQLDEIEVYAKKE